MPRVGLGHVVLGLGLVLVPRVGLGLVLVLVPRVGCFSGRCFSWHSGAMYVVNGLDGHGHDDNLHLNV